MKKEICSPAEHPVVERFYPDVPWKINDLPDNPLEFDAYNHLIVDSKWAENLRHVTPQERFDAFYRLEQAAETQKRQLESYVPRSTKDGVVYATLNTSAIFKVEELIYPGAAAVAVTDKWIYAVHTGNRQILAEVYAASGAEMYCRYNPTFRANTTEPPPDIRLSEGKIPLPMIVASDVGTDIGFFISPFRLTKEAADYLIKDQKRLKAAVVCAVRVSANLLYAAVPDPYQWTEDAHNRFFAPLLNAYQEFVLNPERHARVTIASALQSALDGNQIRFIQKKLALKAEQPRKFLSRYVQDRERLYVSAEVAASYLYNCIDAPEHRIVELAGEHADTETLSFSFAHWAVVSDRLIETAQGQRFALTASEYSERLPIKFFFTEESNSHLLERLNEMFPNTRYGWQSAMAIVGEWSPSQFAKAPKGAELRKIINALEHLGLKDGTKAFAPKQFKLKYKRNQKITKLLYNNLKQMAKEAEELTPTLNPRTLTSGANKYDAKLIENLYKQIAETEMKQRIKVVPHTPSFANRSTARMTQVYEKYFKNVRLPLSVIIETINIVNSVNALIENDDPNETIFKWISVTGATTDFLSVLAAPLAEHLDKQAVDAATRAAEFTANAAKANNPMAQQFSNLYAHQAALEEKSAAMWGTRVKIAGGIIGMIAGTCQMIDELKQTHDALKTREYGIAVGHGIAATGAFLTVVGGGMSLYATLYPATAAGAALGPWGLLVSVVGVTLIFTGNIIAAILSPNAFEQFARCCFLGEDYDISNTVKFEWAETALPTRDIFAELRELLRILCGFQLELEETFLEYHPPSTTMLNRRNIKNLATHIKIKFGYVTPNAQIDIIIQHSYGSNGSAAMLETHLRLLPNEDTISHVRGEMHFEEDGNTIKRDDNGSVSEIRLNIKPKTSQPVQYLNDIYGQPLRMPGLAQNAKCLDSNEIDWRKVIHPVSCRVKVRASMASEGVYIPSRFEYVQIETTETEIQNKINKRIFPPHLDSYNTAVSSLDKGVKVY